ncbi:hypothetical protein ACHAWF_011359 [Thalassiosira exigua]
MTMAASLNCTSESCAILMGSSVNLLQSRIHKRTLY